MGVVWPTEKLYLIIFVKVCAATLFVRHAVKTTKNIARETFTAFNTWWFALRGAGQVVAGCWACRHAWAVVAVGRTWYTCKNKESPVIAGCCALLTQCPLRSWGRYHFVGGNMTNTHTQDVHTYLIVLKLQVKHSQVRKCFIKAISMLCSHSWCSLISNNFSHIQGSHPCKYQSCFTTLGGVFHHEYKVI